MCTHGTTRFAGGKAVTVSVAFACDNAFFCATPTVEQRAQLNRAGNLDIGVAGRRWDGACDAGPNGVTDHLTFLRRVQGRAHATERHLGGVSPVVVVGEREPVRRVVGRSLSASLSSVRPPRDPTTAHTLRGQSGAPNLRGFSHEGPS